MHIIQAIDYNDLSKKAADRIAAQIRENPDSVLGLATGSSPLAAYGLLIRQYEQGKLDFSRITTVNLDEYRGLGPENSQSYRYYMDRNLFDHVNIDKSRTFLPDGLGADPEAVCRGYDQLLEDLGGTDLQLLGLGHNGHIGFNEPADAFPRDTHCVNLAESTIAANRRFFQSEADVPRQAYTMGIRGIFLAEKILLLVSGQAKASILKAALCGPITPRVPASILQLHRDVTVLADEAALSELR